MLLPSFIQRKIAVVSSANRHKDSKSLHLALTGLSRRGEKNPTRNNSTALRNFGPLKKLEKNSRRHTSCFFYASSINPFRVRRKPVSSIRCTCCVTNENLPEASQPPAGMK